MSYGLSNIWVWAIIAQLTVIIPDQYEGSDGIDLSCIPVICNLRAKTKFRNKDLIKLQHIIINNGKVLKCWSAVWCEHKVIDCVHSITATRLCMERCKQHISSGSFVRSIRRILRVTWALPKILSPNNRTGTLTNTLSMVESKENP